MSVAGEMSESVSALNIRLSSYLDKLASQVFDLEQNIGSAVWSSNAPAPETITNVQLLDYLRQSLEDLAMLTLLLGRSDQLETVFVELNSISESLKLDTTKSVLRGMPVVEFGSKVDDRDEVDLF